jgi:hypothetical protein
MSEQSDLHWAEGDPAHRLEEGVSYVRAWARAQHAATSLKDGLANVGRRRRHAEPAS